MVDAIHSVTQQLATLALDAYFQRHCVLANNIANVHSEGFQPQRLNFEEQLGAVRAAVNSGAGDDEISSLAQQVKPFVEDEKVQDSAGVDKSVRLDDQVARVVQNTVQYEALITAMGKTHGLMNLAITGG